MCPTRPDHRCGVQHPLGYVDHLRVADDLPGSVLPPLGPQGYGALRLGMTKSQALGTGMTAGMVTTTGGTCGGPEDGSLFDVTPNPDDTDVAGRLFFSATTDSLVAIYAAAGVATPQGISLGQQ